MENDNSLLGQRIKIEREAQNMQQKDLAAIVGVAASTIQRYEAGTFKAPKLPVIESIAKCLNVDPMWLLGKTDKKDRDKEIVSLGKADLPLSPEEEQERLLLIGFRQLDESDKGIIVGEIRQMLRDDKYSDKKAIGL